MTDYDLLIRNGKIVDGTGAQAFIGSVAVLDGMIVAVGPDVAGTAKETIDASGMLITPGFVDVHTHYDGQVTWDNTLEPSFSHGTSTIVVGNCGVGFAPVRPQDHGKLIELMEGVEDIPGAALWEGIRWDWETFPQYLDILQDKQWTMDVAVMATHGPLRLYVMGDRAVRDEPATPDDIAQMASLVAEAVDVGAVGFSSSRFFGHQTLDGKPVPGTRAGEDELASIGHELGKKGAVFQLIPGGAVGGTGTHYPDEKSITSEIKWMSRLSRRENLTISFLISEHSGNPLSWRQALDLTDQANDTGAVLRPQTGSRPVGMLTGLGLRHLFQRRPTFMRLANLPFDQLVAELRRPEIKQAILSEANVPPESNILADNLHLIFAQMLDGRIFPLGDPLNYEPSPEDSVSAQAEQLGISAEERFYDLMLEQDGRAVLFAPILNYLHGNFDTLHSLLSHPSTIVSLGDGGAHCSLVCDCSTTTHLLTHWVRDRKRGPRFDVEHVIRKQTAETAALFGFTDRGVLAPGMRADINVIDFDRLTLKAPYTVNDLPAGGRRVLQDASGYVATIVHGVVTRRNDTDTGARPGRLLRKTRPPFAVGAE